MDGEKILGGGIFNSLRLGCEGRRRLGWVERKYYHVHHGIIIFIIAVSPISDSSGHQKKAINARSENMSLSFRQGRQCDELNNVGNHFTTFR